MKILICNDGSEQGERAVRVGAEIAAGCQAEVTLLGISESAGTSKTIVESLQRGQSLLEDKKIHAELVTKTGDPIEEIRRRTQEHHFDLVIIGAVRKENRGLFWMSPKSYKLIKEIPSPVLTVAGKVTTITRVLICSGGKRYIDNAVHLSGQIARATKATVTLLHVMPEPPALYAHLPRMEETTEWLLNSRSELGLNLRYGKESLEALGVAAEVRLRQGSVLEQILREVHQGNYDLVVTGSALSRSLRTYMLGDISREIVNRANCAILVVRGKGKPKEPHFSLRGLFRAPLPNPPLKEKE